jgi:hypothetical protein
VNRAGSPKLVPESARGLIVDELKHAADGDSVTNGLEVDAGHGGLKAHIFVDGAGLVCGLFNCTAASRFASCCCSIGLSQATLQPGIPAELRAASEAPP